MNRTSVYKRLPPDSGTPLYEKEVHLSGFRNIKVESRVKSERQIAEFMKYCERDADHPAARMILGPWGEGKTEAFYRYIQPTAENHGHLAFLVTARSIANAYVHYEGLDTSEARLFLGAIFHALRDEGISEIPRYHETKGFVQWIETCLQALRCDNRKLYFFVDEVEQLLHEPTDLRRLMLGIKQILDGKFASLVPGGAFAGSVFIFFACTPEAYNRIATDPDVRQVFGGYGRRMDKIDIEPISLRESVEFLFGLLKYSYEGKLPKLLPVASPGVLSALATIAKRNMGHMVSLTTRLLSSMDQKNGTLEVVGSEQLEAFAIGRTINIEGQDTKCFEDNLYNLILKRIEKRGAEGKFYKRLFAVALFNQKAFSMSDISKLFGKEMFRGMEKVWMNFLKQTLIELGYPPGLLAFWETGGNLQREAIFDNLASFADRGDRNTFRFGEKLFTKQYIEDLLTDWEFDEHSELIPKMLLPANKETVEHLFGPLSSADEEQILNLFEDLASVREIFYRLPKDLIDQVFPPPCPPGLEFIRDASDRFNLWRRATVEYTERLERDLPRALVALILRSVGKSWYFAPEKPIDLGLNIYSATLKYEKESPQKSISLLAWILGRAQILERDIGSCEKLLAKSPQPPHIMIFLLNESVSPNVLSSISSRMKIRSCFVNIHPTYAKQMLATFWHIDAGGAIWEDTLQRAREALLGRDLALFSIFDKWLSTGRTAGFVIDNPALSEGTHKGLVNALRLLLNTQGEGKNLNEIFDWNRNILRGLIPYGSRSGLVPETDRLESFDGFRALVGDLQTNGFVRIDAENRPVLVLSPCEKMILKELSFGDIQKGDWINHLAVLAVPGTIVEDLYVEALVQRGLVGRIKGRGRGTSKNLRRLLKSEEVCKEASQRAKEFRRRVDIYTQNFPSFSAIAHVIVAKERDVQVITLADILVTIDKRLDSIRCPKNDLESCANAAFLMRFIEESGDLLLRKAMLAKQIIQSVPQSLLKKYNEYLIKKLPSMLSDTRQILDFPIDIASLEELKDLKVIVEETEISEEGSEDSKESLRKIVQELSMEEQKRHFWFDTVSSDDSLHNYYAYEITLDQERCDGKAKALDRLLTSIEEKINRPKERQDTLYRRLTSRRVSKSAKISRKILEMLKLQVQPQSTREQLSGEKSKIGSVVELSQIIDHKLSGLSRSITDLEKSCDIWERICAEENDFLSAFDSAKERLQCAKTKFNLKEHELPLQNIEAFLEEGQQGHNSLTNKVVKVSPQDLDDIKTELISLKEHIEETDKLIESELWKPFLRKRATLLAQLGKRIDTCQALGDLPESFEKHYKLLIKMCEAEGTQENFFKSPRSCNEELAVLEKMNAKAGDILNRHLSEAERSVFNSIIDFCIESGSETGIDLDTLKDKVPSSLCPEILSIVKSLWEKGILSFRVFL